MAWLSRKRALICGCFLIWCISQIAFFIPDGWPSYAYLNILSASGRDTVILSKDREALLIGAYSDRFDRWSRSVLIPFLKSKGIQKVRVMVSGHDSESTRALPGLQKNFMLKELIYPEDQAIRMRKTFQRVRLDQLKLSRMSFGKLEQNCFWRIERTVRADGRYVFFVTIPSTSQKWGFDGQVMDSELTGATSGLRSIRLSCDETLLHD